MTTKAELDIGGTRLELSNLDKVFYPEVGFTKAQVVDYYMRIAPVLLPHLNDRPISLNIIPVFDHRPCDRSRQDRRNGRKATRGLLSR